LDGNGIGYRPAERIGAAGGQVRVRPAFDLDSQRSAGPPGSGVGVYDAEN
jgi:hypothetical protein